jgi:hypothetical protein
MPRRYAARSAGAQQLDTTVLGGVGAHGDGVLLDELDEYGGMHRISSISSGFTSGLSLG